MVASEGRIWENVHALERGDERIVEPAVDEAYHPVRLSAHAANERVARLQACLVCDDKLAVSDPPLSSSFARVHGTRSEDLDKRKGVEGLMVIHV